MNAYVYIAIFAAVFVVLSMYIKSKSVQVFLLLCGGYILSSTFSDTLAGEIKTTVETGSAPLTSIVRGSLLLLPPALGILASRGSVKKKRAPIHFVASLAAALLGYLWFIEVLPKDQHDLVSSANVTRELLRAKDVALVAGLLSAIALLFVEKPKPSDDDKKKKH